MALLITELVQKNLIYERDEKSSTVGRKTRLIRINEKAFEFLSVRLRHHTVYMHLCDINGQIKACQNVDLDMSVHDGNAADVVSSIVGVISDFEARFAENPKKIMAMALVVPGMFTRMEQLTGWNLNGRRVPLGGAIQYAIGVPVFVDIALRIQGSYEIRFLPEELRNKSVVFLSLEPGIGLAYYLGGKILQGKNNMFGEIGHVSPG